MDVLVIDSGKGGRVLYRYLKSMNPNINIIYASDEKNMPYGDKNTSQIVYYTKKLIEPYGRDYKILAPACNTMSVALLGAGMVNYRVVDIVTPTIRELKRQKLRHLGVISTPYTHNSKIYSRKLSAISVPSKNLARLVEFDDMDGVRKELERIIPPLIDRKVKRLILGCTHYELIDYVIRDMYPHLELLYPAKYQAEAVLKRLNRLKEI